MQMETGPENVPEFIECYGNGRSDWPNISGAKFTGVDDYSYSNKMYRYTFNILNKKASFSLQLIGREFESEFESFKIRKEF
jgi:hypothetical protein